jgi:hypothetical protein
MNHGEIGNFSNLNSSTPDHYLDMLNGETGLAIPAKLAISTEYLQNHAHIIDSGWRNMIGRKRLHTHIFSVILFRYNCSMIESEKTAVLPVPVCANP